MVLIVAYFVVRQKETNEEPIKKTVTISSTQAIQPVKININKNNKNAVLEESLEIEPTSEEEIISLAENLTQLSYLQVYKKRLRSVQCGLLYYRNKNTDADFDYVTTFKDEIKYLSNGRQTIASEQQIETYSLFVEECLQLEKEAYALLHLKQIQANDESTSVYRILSKLLSETEALSQEELALKQVLAESSELSKQYELYTSFEYGDFVLSKEEKLELNREIQQIRNELRSQLKEDSLAYEQDSYKQLLAELKSKADRVEQRTGGDEKQLSQIKAQFEQLYLSLESKLTSTYASVFKEAFKALTLSTQMTGLFNPEIIFKEIEKTNSEFLPVSEKIYLQTLAKDKKYYSQIITPALELYLCFLGENCDSDSDLVKNKCAIEQSYGSGGIFQQACDLTLEEFYFEVYLSPNQVDDVIFIINHLMRSYAP